VVRDGTEERHGRQAKSSGCKHTDAPDHPIKLHTNVCTSTNQVAVCTQTQQPIRLHTQTHKPSGCTHKSSWLLKSYARLGCVERTIVGITIALHTRECILSGRHSPIETVSPVGFFEVKALWRLDEKPAVLLAASHRSEPCGRALQWVGRHRTLRPSIAVGRCITLRPSIMIAAGRHRTLRPSMTMGRYENPAVLLAGSTLDLYQVRRQSVTVDRKDARKDPQDPPAKIQPATNLV